MSANWRKAAAAAVVGFLLNATGANALNLAWVHANAAAQSEQRVKAGFDAWLKETGKDWNVSLLDSGGSGERTASNLQDAASRGVDAIIITMADLRASRAAIDAAVDAKIPIITVDSGYIPGVLVDVTTNNWAMSSDVSPYLLNELGGKGRIIFLRMAEHHGTRKRGDVMETILREYPDVKVLPSTTSTTPPSSRIRHRRCRIMHPGSETRSTPSGLPGTSLRKRRSTCCRLPASRT